MKTIMAIGAHPDDIEIGCGGTLAGFAARGARIIQVIVTSGEEGGFILPKSRLAEIREQEARASARLLGAAEVVFLREPDGLMTCSLEAKARLISLLREHRPDAVFTHSSSDGFPDHRAVHLLTCAAITAAGGPWYPEAVPSVEHKTFGAQSDLRRRIAHRVPGLFGYEVWAPMPDHQASSNIDDTIEMKIDALRCHASQLRDVDYADAVRGLARYRGIMTMTGAHAEVFEVLRTGALQ